METNLLLICFSAFTAVFVLLAFLAMVMRLILTLFPQKETGIDSAVVAAVTSTLQTIFPGSKITKIEEVR